MFRIASGVDLVESNPEREKEKTIHHNIIWDEKYFLQWGISHLSQLTRCCSHLSCGSPCRPDSEPGPHLCDTPGMDAPLEGSLAVQALQSKGKLEVEVGWDVMTVLWALCRIGRLEEAGALGLSWPEDAAAAGVSQLLQTESLSGA